MFLWPPPPGPAPLGRSGVPLALCSCGSLLYSLPRSAHGVPRPSGPLYGPVWGPLCALSHVPMAHGRAPGAAAPHVPMAAPPWRPPPAWGQPVHKIGWYRVHPLKCNIDARKARQPPAAPALKLPAPRATVRAWCLWHAWGRKGPTGPARRGPLRPWGGDGPPSQAATLYGPMASRPIPPTRADPPPLPQRVPSSQGLGWSPCYVSMQPRTIPLRESQGLRKSSRCPMFLWRADP